LVVGDEAGYFKLSLSFLLVDAGLVVAPYGRDAVSAIATAGTRPQRHHHCRPAGYVEKVCPVGTVQITVPSANCRSAQPPMPVQKVLSR